MPEHVFPNQRIPYRKYRNCMNGPLKEPGYAAISVDENYISLRAILYDTDMYSESTGEDQPMWMLGDVLEFFFWLPPRNDYYETQVSINGDKLQIHLNEFYIVYDLPLESILGKCGMQAKVRRFPSKNVWYGKIQIPLKEIGVEYKDLEGLRFFSGRYNHNHAWDEPELSATCKFEGGSFHSPTEWSILHLNKDNAK